jgi:hypothetical protein
VGHKAEINKLCNTNQKVKRESVSEVEIMYNLKVCTFIDRVTEATFEIHCLNLVNRSKHQCVQYVRTSRHSMTCDIYITMTDNAQRYKLRS